MPVGSRLLGASESAGEPLAPLFKRQHHQHSLREAHDPRASKALFRWAPAERASGKEDYAGG